MLFKSCLLGAAALTVTAQYSTPFTPPSTYQEFLFLLQQQQQQLQQPSTLDQAQQPPSPPDRQFSPSPPSPFPECLPIQSTSACAPWSNGFYINTTELTRIYALSSPITTDIWNTQVVRTTSGGPHQSTIWKNWSGCDGYNGELIQYSRTYVCLTDIFLFSAGCNAEQQGKLDICDGVCDAYGDAVGKLVDNEKVCPKSEDVEIGKRRTALKNASDGCKKILKNWNNPDTSKCANGVIDDLSSCGFAANQPVKSIYCSKNPTASCCLTTPIPLRSSSSLISSVDENSSSTSSSSSALPLGGIIGIAVSAILIIIAIASVFIIRKRKRSKKPLVTPIKTGMFAVKSNSPTLSRELKTVSTAYKADMPDELTLRVGDVVEVTEVYSDGWARGTNVTTGANGVFPAACLN